MIDRVLTNGKHFELDGRAFRVRGVTYGSFASRLDGHRFPDRHQIELHATSIVAGSTE